MVERPEMVALQEPANREMPKADTAATQIAKQLAWARQWLIQIARRMLVMPVTQPAAMESPVPLDSVGTVATVVRLTPATELPMVVKQQVAMPRTATRSAGLVAMPMVIPPAEPTLAQM